MRYHLAYTLGLSLSVVLGCSEAEHDEVLPAELVADQEMVVLDRIAGAQISKPKIIKFTNVGTVPTPSLKSELSGETDIFHIQSDSCAGKALAAGERCEITVVMDSLRVGEAAAELRVFAPSLIHDAEVFLTGKTAPAQIELLSSPVQSRVTARQASSLLTQSMLEAKNVGGVSSGPISLSDIAPLSATAECPNGIPPGGSCKIMIDYPGGIPLDAKVGELRRILELRTESSAASAEIVVNITETSTLEFSSFEFNKIDMWSFVSQPIILRNHGDVQTAPLTVSLPNAVNLVSNVGFAITEDHCSGHTLEPEQTCQLLIQARFDVEGDYHAMLSVSAPNVHPATTNLNVHVKNAALDLIINKPGHGEVMISTNDADIFPDALGLRLNRVLSDVVGIPVGIPVKLTAKAGIGSTFTGWSGACTGNKPTCIITAQDPTSVTVTAAFD